MKRAISKAYRNWRPKWQRYKTDIKRRFRNMTRADGEYRLDLSGRRPQRIFGSRLFQSTGCPYTTSAARYISPTSAWIFRCIDLMTYGCETRLRVSGGCYVAWGRCVFVSGCLSAIAAECPHPNPAGVAARAATDRGSACAAAG